MLDDDTNLFYAEKNIILLDTVNIEFQKISQRFISNKLSLNVIKNYSFFHKLSKKYNILLVLPKLHILCNDEIKRSESIKFLGASCHCITVIVIPTYLTPEQLGGLPIYET